MGPLARRQRANGRSRVANRREEGQTCIWVVQKDMIKHRLQLDNFFNYGYLFRIILVILLGYLVVTESWLLVLLKYLPDF